MFRDLLSFPIQNLHHFSYLLKQLCGKNRYQFGRFVFEYCNRLLIDSRDGHNITPEELRGKGGSLQQSQPLMSELLASLLILLFQQQSGQLNTQEKFDSLSNILVLVSKIIKQQPTYYVQLNDLLYQMKG